MKKIITIARLKQIANAIRQKTNKTGALTLGQMPAEINSIEIFKGVGKFSDLKIFIPTSITQAQWNAGYDSMKLLLSSADVSSLTFKNCSSLTSLNLNFWDGGQRTSMDEMFYGCQALTSLDLSNFNWGSSLTFSSMFANCKNLENLNVGAFQTQGSRDIDQMFSHCEKIKHLDFSNFHISSSYFAGTSLQGAFSYCSELETVILPPCNVKYIYVTSLFDFCDKLKNIDLTPLADSPIAGMNYMFRGCSTITSLDLSMLKYNTSILTEFSEVFRGCSNLRSLDLSSFSMRQISRAVNPFQACFKLSIINWPAVLSLASYTGTFNLSPCPLNHDSCLALFNALQDCNGRTVKLSTTTKELMSADELKIATDKGVTIA